MTNYDYLLVYFSRISVMKKTIFALLVLIAVPCYAQTTGIFRVGDQYNANGNGGLNPNAVNSASNVYNAVTGVPGDPSNYNAYMVGASYGQPGNGIYRSTLDFNLGSLPAAPAGMMYNVTGVMLNLEQSGPRPSATIDTHEGGPLTGALGAANGSAVMPANSDGTFTMITLNSWSLDLNTDNNYILTLDAPNAASGEYHTFGSDLGPGNTGIYGTPFVDKSPYLDVKWELVGIPEPSAMLLGFFASFWALCFHRRRW